MMAAFSPAAKTAMAAAVERPIPGRVSRISCFVGKKPRYSEIMIWAHLCRLRALE